MEFKNMKRMTNCAGCQYCTEGGELPFPAGQCPHGQESVEFVNLTPHSVVVAGVEFPASGEVLRLDTMYKTPQRVGTYLSISKVEQTLVDTPPVVEGRYYIVSAMVGQAVSRPDFVCPDTNRAKRNEQGHIISVPGFVQY